MGNQWIWIGACVAFALVSAGIYTWVRGKREGALRRYIIAAVLYLGLGLAICRLLLALFA